MSSIAVVHLVRLRNGLAPFAAFLDSCRKYPAGLPYDFVSALKGFYGQA